MLIRGQTTEQRIADIANAFKQGVDGYAAGQRRFNDAQKEENRYQDAKALQSEATKRQQALQELEIEAKLSETTGKNFMGSGAGKQFFSGNYRPEDYQGLGLTRRSELDAAKVQRDKEAQILDDEYKKSMIRKNNNTATTPPMTYGQKLDLKAEKEKEAKDAERANPEYKLEKLGAEGRSKVGAIASGFQALDQMVKASDDGHGPQYVDANSPVIGSLVSDNPYSEAERTVAEVVGRLQSGGAMNVTEVKTFKALGPRPGDDAPTRARKLGQQRDFLQNKLTAFGLKNDDMNSLGFKTISDYAPKNQAPQQNADSLRAELEQRRALKAQQQAGQ